MLRSLSHRAHAAHRCEAHASLRRAAIRPTPRLAAGRQHGSSCQPEPKKSSEQGRACLALAPRSHATGAAAFFVKRHIAQPLTPQQSFPWRQRGPPCSEPSWIPCLAAFLCFAACTCSFSANLVDAPPLPPPCPLAGSLDQARRLWPPCTPALGRLGFSCKRFCTTCKQTSWRAMMQTNLLQGHGNQHPVRHRASRCNVREQARQARRSGR